MKTSDLVGGAVYGYVGVKTIGVLWPAIRLVLVICVLWLMVAVPFDCAYMAITGNPSLFPTKAESAAMEKQQDEELTRKWKRERTASLISKMHAGDLVAQTDLASDYLHSDDTTNDRRAVQLMVDAADKDCSKAQSTLGNMYWVKGDKSKARELWILAAQGREERTYGTGSYQARHKLKYYFPADYDSRWDSD